MYYSKFSKDPKEHAWDMLQEAISSRLPAKSNQQLPGTLIGLSFLIIRSIGLSAACGGDF